MKKSLVDFDFKGKRALVRVDFNVPIVDGTITDNRRIVSALPTINYLLDNGASVVLMSHLGRPKDEYDEKFSLKPVAEELSNVLGRDVIFVPSEVVVDDEVVKKVGELKPGDVCLIENTRFVKGEKKNAPEFSKKLSRLGDIYIDDAFGTSHRAHASNVGITEYLPSGLGLLMEKEVKFLKGAMDNPAKPFYAIIGGAKVSDKIGVIENLLTKVDGLIIVGAMAYTFLKSRGIEVGKSLVEDDKLDLARSIEARAEELGVKLLITKDVVVADSFSEDANTKVVSVEEIPEDMEGLDIGPKTIDEIREMLKDAKTVIWNGPAGVFEMEKFAKGTYEIAKILSELDGITIVGGGDSASAVEKSGLASSFTHISTGGGASLELFEGKVLPGIEAIEDRDE